MARRLRHRLLPRGCAANGLCNGEETNSGSAQCLPSMTGLFFWGFRGLKLPVQSLESVCRGGLVAAACRLASVAKLGEGDVCQHVSAIMCWLRMTVMCNFVPYPRCGVELFDFQPFSAIFSKLLLTRSTPRPSPVSHPRVSPQSLLSEGVSECTTPDNPRRVPGRKRSPKPRLYPETPDCREGRSVTKAKLLDQMPQADL